MTFLPLRKEDSIVARHYAAKFGALTRVEYIGDKPKAACIKQIDVNSEVYSVSYSPDGKLIVSGSKENVCIWDAVNGGLVFDPFRGESFSVNFSSGGQYIASGNADGTIAIWNSATGESFHDALVGHTSGVYSIAFSPDSKYIASGSFDRTVRIWDVEKGMAIGEPFQGHSNTMHSVSDLILFSPSGIYFASSSHNEIIVREVESREMKYPPLMDQSGVCSFAFSHDSSKIVSGTERGTLAVWDVSEGTILRKFSGVGAATVFSVAYSPDDKYILSGSDDRVIRIWDAEDSEVLPKLFRGHTHIVKSVSYAPDGTRFVSGSYDETIRIWDVEGGQLVKHFGLMSTAAVSVDGKYLVTGSEGGAVTVWSIETSEVLNGPFEGHSDWVTSLSFSPVPDGCQFASGSDDKTIRIWKVNGESVTCYGHTDQVSSVCFSPDGRHVASGSWDGTIRVWDSESGALVIKTLEGQSDRIFSVCYSSDGARVVSGSDDKTVRIWDSSNGNLLSTLEGHSDTVYSITCSHNSSLIISGDNGGTIRVWDANSEILVHELSGSGDQVLSLCASPNDSWFTSTNWEGTIFLWNALTGNLFLKTNLSSSPNSIAFLPSTDPRYIEFASASYDGLIRIWCFDLHSQKMAWNLRNDGWLTRNDGDLLFWIPSDLRSGLINNQCTRILNGQFLTKLILSENQGSRWTVCYHPRPEPSSTLYHPNHVPCYFSNILAFYTRLIPSSFIRLFFSSG